MREEPENYYNQNFKEVTKNSYQDENPDDSQFRPNTSNDRNKNSRNNKLQKVTTA